jgi:SAM-dependent methyltransferase
MRDELKAFVELFARTWDPPAPVVEIGALQTPGQEQYADLRAAFPGKAYVGCDVVAGPGVDRLEDVHALTFADGCVGTVVAADSLEHVADPRRAMAEIARVLAPGGVCLVTTPFNFPIHHPPDYQRFTPEGMATLLGAFPAAVVWGSGDAQWPHTVYAVAGKPASADAAAAFAVTARALADAWHADGTWDPLVPFVPLASVARHDTGDVRPAPLAPAVEQPFACRGADLSRIDVRLAAEGARTPCPVTLTLAEADAPARTVATAAVRLRAPFPPRWVAFRFPPLADSAGRRYAFRLTAPDTRDTRFIASASPDGTLCFDAFGARPPAARVAAGAPASAPAARSAAQLVEAILLGPRASDVVRACREAVAAEAEAQRARHDDAVRRIDRLAEQLLRVEVRLEALQRDTAAPAGLLARLAHRLRRRA